MTRALTPREIERLRELSAAGHTYDQIAGEIGCSRTTVHRYLAGRKSSGERKDAGSAEALIERCTRSEFL